MITKTFTSGRIRRADYDASARQLELHWDNGQALAYKQVPDEVFRRLCSAPNPATYWEDRIAEEYPKARAAAGAKATDGAKGFDALFGGGADDVSA